MTGTRAAGRSESANAAGLFLGALEQVATGAIWGEGPVWIPERRSVIWSDIPGNRILEFDAESGVTRVYRDDVEYTNGRTLDRLGRVVQCSHGRRALEREEGGETVVLVDSWSGHRLNSPNDVVVKSDGTIWFSDPPYGIVQPHEGHPGEREYGDNYVFRFDPATGALDPVVIDVEEPNGLAFSPDESILYVSDTSVALRADGSGNRHIRAYDVIDGRACKNGRVVATAHAGVVDGFRVDETGCLWTSSADAVVVLDEGGAELARIAVPEPVGNLCFGGDDGRDLYVAATTSLYRVRVGVRDAVRGRS